MKRRLAVGVGLVLVLMVSAFVLATLRPSPGFTVRCSKVAPFGDSLRVTLQVNNNTTRALSVLPVRLERYVGGTWEKCQYGLALSTELGDLGPHSSSQVFCLIKPEPAGTNLRLVIQKINTRHGLGSFFERLELRLSGKNKNVSLNPLDSTLLFSPDPAQVSVEFVVP